MMKIEAECLLGRELDEDEFEKLHFVYMESTLDKQAVCEAWKDQKDTSLLVDLADKVAQFREEYRKLSISHRELSEKVKQNKAFANKIKWVNFKLNDSYIVFERDQMKCVVFAKPARKCFVGGLFNKRGYPRLLKYVSREPMPNEAKEALALLGYEVEGPL